MFDGKRCREPAVFVVIAGVLYDSMMYDCWCLIDKQFWSINNAEKQHWEANISHSYAMFTKKSAINYNMFVMPYKIISLIII